MGILAIQAECQDCTGHGTVYLTAGILMLVGGPGITYSMEKNMERRMERLGDRKETISTPDEKTRGSYQAAASFPTMAGRSRRRRRHEDLKREEGRTDPPDPGPGEPHLAVDSPSCGPRGRDRREVHGHERAGLPGGMPGLHRLRLLPAGLGNLHIPAGPGRHLRHGEENGAPGRTRRRAAARRARKYTGTTSA